MLISTKFPLIIAILACSFTGTNAEEKAKEIKPLVKQISEHVYQIGKVSINKQTREISFDAQTNIVNPQTPLEFLLTHLNGEKIHESLLVTEADPTNINIALKLLNYKESQELFLPVDDKGAVIEKYPDVPENIRKAARFTTLVTWEEKGKKKNAPITDWLSHRITHKPMPLTPWVYNGSYIHRQAFKAKINGNILAIFPNQSAIANYPGKDRYDDTIWFAKKNLPQEGSKVTLTLKPWTGKLLPTKPNNIE